VLLLILGSKRHWNIKY